MPKRCIVPDCFPESYRTHQSLFKLPRNPIIREKWLLAIRNAYPNLILGKTVTICEKHFKQTDFSHVIADGAGRIIQKSLPDKVKRLKHGVIPHFLDSREHESTSASTSHDVVPGSSRLLAAIKNPRVLFKDDRWIHCDTQFDKMFTQNDFGWACDVCDRLWFTGDLKAVTARQAHVLVSSFPAEAENGSLATFNVCNTCRLSLNQRKVPNLAKTNGFRYPPKPMDLPPLDPITERMVSPQLPFMQIRRLRREGAHAIVSQVINVPVNINTMVTMLPRQLDDDQAFNVNIKQNIIHKSVYLHGYVRKLVVKAWLRYLLKTPLYQDCKITVDWSILDRENNYHNMKTVDKAPLIEPLKVDGDQQVPESKVLLARQNTLLWHEILCSDIAPSARNTPMNLLYDRHAEELSFPGIYYGVPRSFNTNISVTPYMIATSEIRRRDRRGVTPAHILYMAMNMLRHQFVEGLYLTFKTVRETETITRKMLEDQQFVDDCVNKNLAFFKSVPNSFQYWADRKKDLFAMIRQLGKPTMFMKLSANEIRWPHLLGLLHKLRNQFHDIRVIDLLADLSRSQRCSLVNEDPVTCCIYFNKLVDVIMLMLQSSRSSNPFGEFRVADYFQCIKFPHQGSPHVHIFMWLENDPKEPVSEVMPKTIELIEKLCSVSRQDLPEVKYANQVHQHTFTCIKRGETTCRFSIPYWPMQETCVLLPLSKEDKRRDSLCKKATKLRQLLEEKVYKDVEEFLNDNMFTLDGYFDVIRSTLHRPTIIFKRTPDERYTNTFHPWISKVLNSNMDLQFILDEYSCAAYVAEYVNISSRGISDLHRHLLELEEDSLDSEYNNLLKRLSLQLLNMVEMSPQEASWYLLRQSMNRCSRQIIYIPTVWRHERQKSCKHKSTMDRENITSDSTDIWTRNIIQRYEDRPSELDHIYLANFAANYMPQRSSLAADMNYDHDEEGVAKTKKRRVQFDESTRDSDSDTTDDDHDSDIEDEAIDYKIDSYCKRRRSRVIRYRNYDIKDVDNYKREMVLLYLPFRNELADILDRNKFLQLFDANKELILKRCQEYESDIDIKQIMVALRELRLPIDESIIDVKAHERFMTSVLGDQRENTDDIDLMMSSEAYAIVRQRADIMPKQEYCEMLGSTNLERRELILEVIHRLRMTDPLRISSTDPADSAEIDVYSDGEEIEVIPYRKPSPVTVVLE